MENGYVGLFSSFVKVCKCYLFIHTVKYLTRTSITYILGAFLTNKYSVPRVFFFFFCFQLLFSNTVGVMKCFL